MRIKLFFLFLMVEAASCHNPTDERGQLPQKPPTIYVDSKDTALHNNNGTWILKGIPFNGFIIEKIQNIKRAELPVINGRENGIAREWYADGKLKSERAFLKGNRNGKQKGWYENGELSYDHFFIDDKFEGEQKYYFKDGKIWQTLNYKNGYEEGKQKSWNESGKVVNNFTVKNGKLYGVVGRYDCMSVYKK